MTDITKKASLSNTVAAFAAMEWAKTLAFGAEGFLMERRFLSVTRFSACGT